MSRELKRTRCVGIRARPWVLLGRRGDDRDGGKSEYSALAIRRPRLAGKFLKNSPRRAVVPVNTCAHRDRMGPWYGEVDLCHNRVGQVKTARRVKPNKTKMARACRVGRNTCACVPATVKFFSHLFITVVFFTFLLCFYCCDGSPREPFSPGGGGDGGGDDGGHRSID